MVIKFKDRLGLRMLHSRGVLMLTKAWDATLPAMVADEKVEHGGQSSCCSHIRMGEAFCLCTDSV